MERIITINGRVNYVRSFLKKKNLKFFEPFNYIAINQINEPIDSRKVQQLFNVIFNDDKVYIYMDEQETMIRIIESR